MKNFFLIISFLSFFTLQSYAQQYPLVTLQDINIVPDSLWPIFPPSPLAGDTVRVRGMVMVHPIVSTSGNRTPIVWAGSRWCTYIQDQPSQAWGGLQIIQNDTIGAAQGTFLDLADTATVYEFTGVVTPYFQSTQLSLITNPQPIPISLVASYPDRANPIPLQLSDFQTPSGGMNYTLRKYQGMYVVINADETHPLIVSDRVTGTGSASGNFKINDLNGHFAWNYAQSRYFKSNANGLIPGYQPPPDGSYISYIKGVLTIRADAYYIVPCYPGDIGMPVANPPLITNVLRNSATVMFNQPVTVSAVIRGGTGYVTEAKLFYRVNGVQDSILMTRSFSDSTNYLCTIPGIPDSAFVDYFIRAKDNQGITSTNPVNVAISRYSYFVLNRPLTIQDVRYSPFGSGYSGYNGYHVTLTGVVTADTSDIPGNHGSNPSRVYMQNGSGAWSGIPLGVLGFNGVMVLNLKRGDKITVSGTILMGSFGTKIDSLTSITVNSQNNPLPAPNIVNTGVVGTSVLGTIAAEQWSGTLVTYMNVVVDSVNADGTSNFGESFVNNGLPHTRVVWSDGNTTYHNGLMGSGYTLIQKGDRFASLTGVLGFTHSQYKLTPRKNSDVLGYSHPGAITWEMPLRLQSGVDTSAMYIGQGPAATNGIDIAYGEEALPPVPPAGIFDSRFEIPVTPAEYSLRDFRNDTVRTINWLMRFQPGPSGYPIVAAWNPAGLPAGTFFLKDNITGTLVNVNMKTQSSYLLTNTGITSLVIEYKRQVCKDVSAVTGWNIVSVPVLAADMSVTSLFPASNSPAYFYNNGYSTVSQMGNGKGYWLRFSTTQTVTLCGSLVNSLSVPVAAGWNLIGVYANNVPVAAVTTTPANILNSQFYGFSNGYNHPTELESGKGYWIRASQNGIINLTAISKQSSVAATASIDSKWSRITIRDAKGDQSVLYLAGQPQALQNFDLPPVPPESIFDVRFNSQRYVEMLSAEPQQFTISGAAYPVEIRVEGTDIRLLDKASNGKLLNEMVKNNCPVRITDPAISVIELQSVELPAAYELQQNYPNPFNPATNIRFALPEQARVTLTVYNQLGEKVTILLSETREAGFHTVVWDAGNLPSGIYFYELKTDKYSSVKKLMLMK